VAALITDMDEPLGLKVGNFLEVEESVDCLQGRGPEREVELTCRLAGWMLSLGGLCASPGDGASLARRRLADGSAWELFLRNVQFQGGDVESVKHTEKGPHARLERPVRARAAGFVTRVDAYRTGIASVVLGAGRSRKEDRVFPGVGIVFSRTRGDAVRASDVLCTLFGEDEQKVDEAGELMETACETGPAAPSGRAVDSLVLEEIA
jgi:pyrimidine-nucleoside phosphorylase